jgi:murein DD-endopeptidase MepM/ murein hydrolase activator NlpD
LTGFGWTRLAYLLVVLSALGALAQLGSPSAEPRPLAAEPPGMGQEAGDASTVAGEPHEHDVPAPLSSAGPRESPRDSAFARHLKRATAGGASALPDAGKAVFYRPAPARPPAADPPPAPGEASSPGPVCGDLGRFPGGHRLVFPVPMRYANSYEDTWGAPRPQGGHEGTDLMIPTGTPEYAVTDGTVVPVMGSNGNGWNSLGGYAVMVRAAYSVGPVREGDLFYYAHLERKSALPLGATVRAGQVVGYAGDTGQGPEVTRGLFPPHLHFGWYDAVGTRSYLPSGAMNPYPLLEWVRSGGGVLGGGSDARYCEVPRSGAATPSTGADRWPSPGNDGARPDLDTGTDRPTPSPAVAGEKARVNERQTGPAQKAADAEKRAPGKDEGPAKAAPGKTPGEDPRAPGSTTPDRETTGKPAPREEPAPGAAPPNPDRPSGKDPKHDPGPPAPNRPPEEGGHPGEGQEPPHEEPADREPEEKPEGPPGEDGDQSPGKEEPEGDPAPPVEETTPEETAPETGEPGDPEPQPETTTSAPPEETTTG